jgi:dephospho-CoA kinase
MSHLTVGLTGGIASGKSAVEKCFIELGVPVLDADQVARDVVAPPSPALAQIAARFGPQALLADGSLNRRWLRELVFADADARKDLEAITHPLIGARLSAWRDAQTAPYCILAVAIMVERGFQRLVDRVLVVDAPEALQRQRLIQRDGITDQLATQMIQAQATRERRLAAADDVLGNHGDVLDVKQFVRQLHAFYQSLVDKETPRAPGLHLPRQGL